MIEKYNMPKNLFIFKQNDKEIGRIISTSNIENLVYPETALYSLGSVLTNLGNLGRKATGGDFKLSFEYDLFEKIINKVYYNVNKYDPGGAIFSLKYYYNIFKHTPDESDLDLAISTKNMLDSGYGEIIEFNSCVISGLYMSYRCDNERHIGCAKIKFGWSEIL